MGDKEEALHPDAAEAEGEAGETLDLFDESMEDE
jgi:hypothetical protein